MAYTKRTQQQRSDRRVKAPLLIKSPQKVIRPLVASKNIALSSVLGNLKVLQIICSFSFFLSVSSKLSPPQILSLAAQNYDDTVKTILI